MICKDPLWARVVTSAGDDCSLMWAKCSFLRSGSGWRYISTCELLSYREISTTYTAWAKIKNVRENDEKRQNWTNELSRGSLGYVARKCAHRLGAGDLNYSCCRFPKRNMEDAGEQRIYSNSGTLSQGYTYSKVFRANDAMSLGRDLQEILVHTSDLG